MSDIERIIYEDHIRKEELYQIRYELMGMMLNQVLISLIVHKRKWESIYIYGGGYIGIQAYRAFSPYANVVGMIDRTGGLMIPIDGVRVYSLEEFATEYDRKSPVIITPIEAAPKIYEDLANSIDKERIYYINEIF